MIAARLRTLVFIAIAIAAAAALAVAAVRRGEQRQPTQRPTLLLLTSLPLLFNEDFSLAGSGSPTLKALEARYDVKPISVTSPAELSRGRLLLMAQPQAQAAENLVALDEWVRRGGRVLLLADPMLEWPSKRPLGDLTRPPPMFADTGLLAHWGLRLDAPDMRGVTVLQMGSYKAVTASPGRLKGTCQIADRGLVARCRLGAGEAIVIADADFLNSAALGSAAGHNVDALLEQLAKLSRP